MDKPVTDQVSPKTSEEALAFVQKLQKAFPKTPRSKKQRAALRKYLAQFSDAELRAVGRRVLSDLMQRPPRTITEGDLPPMPTTPPDPRGAPSQQSGPKEPKARAGQGGKPATAAGTRRARRRPGRS
jgi:hypothetical protein